MARFSRNSKSCGERNARLRIVAALCAILSAASAGVAAADAAAEVRESFDLRVPLAPAPVQIEGRSLLRYELHLGNFAGQALTPVALTVLDAASQRVIAVARGDDLTALRGTGLAGPIASGSRDVIYLELLPDSGRLPTTLLHRIEYRAADDRAAPHAVEGARIAIASPGAISLGAPLRGGPWVAIHHPSWPRGHRRVIYTVDGAARIPGRHAIDWVKVDADGRIARGDADLSANHLGLGAEVIAVADARVVALRDDLSTHPDHALGDASGNFVALELGDGRVAFYEHLQPGSVRVAIGQRVRRGSVLGRLGFTGDSTGPHLHFHVADAASPLAAEGLPFALEHFTLLGRYEDIGALGSAPWQPLAADATARRANEAPGSNVVVDFGASRSTGQ